MTYERFDFESKAHFVFFDKGNLQHDELLKIKESLRGKLPRMAFERRLHGTDTRAETKTLLEVLTNPNSLELINNIEVSRRDKLFQRIPQYIVDNPNICLDGSVVLQLHGLRYSRDLDFICTDKEITERLERDGYDLRNERYDWGPISTDTILANPFFHLTIFGIKFVSLKWRHFVLGTKPPLTLHPKLIAKGESDYQSISLLLSESKKNILAWSVFLGTLRAKGRFLYEFIVAQILAKLPNPAYKFLRQIYRMIP